LKQLQVKYLLNIFTTDCQHLTAKMEVPGFSGPLSKGQMFESCTCVQPPIEFEKVARVPTTQRPVIMPIPYSLDLRWRVAWMHFALNRSPADIAQLLCISERTVRRCLTLFYQTGDEEPRPHTNGPKRLLGDFEQVVLLWLVLAYPGIYLHELQSE